MGSKRSIDNQNLKVDYDKLHDKLNVLRKEFGLQIDEDGKHHTDLKMKNKKFTSENTHIKMDNFEPDKDHFFIKELLIPYLT